MTPPDKDPAPATCPAAVATFIARWATASPSERANAQLFLAELCDILGVPRPEPETARGYMFEFPVSQAHPDGSATEGRIDLCKRACFVLEAKQFQTAQLDASGVQRAVERAAGSESRLQPASTSVNNESLFLLRAKPPEGGTPNPLRRRKSGPTRGTEAWDDAMLKARGQAERGVRALPASEPNPPLLLVVDVGHSLEVFADFTQASRNHLHFPHPRAFRILLADLRRPEIRERPADWNSALRLAGSGLRDPARHRSCRRRSPAQARAGEGVLSAPATPSRQRHCRLNYKWEKSTCLFLRSLAIVCQVSIHQRLKRRGAFAPANDRRRGAGVERQRLSRQMMRGYCSGLHRQCATAAAGCGADDLRLLMLRLPGSETAGLKGRIFV
jgi:hypothetical protein